MTTATVTGQRLEDWVWCERYGCRLIGHRDALDGSPQKPICTAEHHPLALARSGWVCDE